MERQRYLYIYFVGYLALPACKNAKILFERAMGKIMT